MEIPRYPNTIDLSKAFTIFKQILVENILGIILITVLCVIAGLLYSFYSPKTFESKMILQSDILSESYSLKLAENLNTHIKDGDFAFLAGQLNLTADEANQLEEFRILSALTPMSQQMDEKDKIIVVISVQVKDNAVLPKLQEGIIAYFSNNEYIRKRVIENRKKYEGMIVALDTEIKRLDTLKNKISKGNFSGSRTGEVSIVDLSGLYEVAADLYEKKFDFMNDLATVDSIQVIEGLTPYGKPIWPKKSVVLFTSLMIAGALILVLLQFKASRAKVVSANT
jgi:uncharacterized protein involved in exopolysaccharide biosynthesis